MSAADGTHAGNTHCERAARPWCSAESVPIARQACRALGIPNKPSPAQTCTVQHRVLGDRKGGQLQAHVGGISGRPHANGSGTGRHCHGVDGLLRRQLGLCCCLLHTPTDLGGCLALGGLLHDSGCRHAALGVRWIAMCVPEAAWPALEVSPAAAAAQVMQCTTGKALQGPCRDQVCAG